jgi:lambda family phage portal protein
LSFLDKDSEMREMLSITPSAEKPPVQAEVLPAGTGGVSAMQGAYDAASRFDRDMVTWTPSGLSADDDLLPEKMVIDARVRDLMRNDAYAQSGGDIWKNNIVGSMFMLNSKPNNLALGLDSTWSEEFQEEVEAKFTLAAESPANWIDASRINSFTAMVRLAVGVYVMAGEVLAYADFITERSEKRPFATAIQMIDLDRLANPPSIGINQNIRGGIEFDKRNRPIAYHIRKARSSSDWFRPDAYQYERVATTKSWGRQNIIHIFEQFRPDQSRGVAKMVAALKESRITKRFRDTVLQNAVVNATYAASIESDLPTEAVYAALGAGQTDDTKVLAALESFAGGYLGAVDAYSGGARNLKLDGVRIPHLFPGTKLQLRPAGQGGPLGTDFEVSLLRYIAANLGISYEQLSKDYTKTNYSSARAAMLETWKTMQANKKMIADRFASHIYMLWFEEAVANGEITTVGKGQPNFWQGLNREAYCGAEWIGASRGQIDELKETQAAVLRINNNLTTYEDELGRLGKDYRRVFEQIEREKNIQEKRGITVAKATDNMMNAASGAPRDKSGPATNAEHDDSGETPYA